jgi:L-ascorbate metabolism protein UlaG (beta-lactamase superfamily)
MLQSVEGNVSFWGIRLQGREIMKSIMGLALCAAMSAAPLHAAGTFETDHLPTPAGDIKITFIGHASLMFEFAGKVIYNDPSAKSGDFSNLPKADLILVSHEHYDHFDPATIMNLSKSGTKIVLTRICSAKMNGIVLKNGEQTTVDGIRIEAVPAYNIINMRRPGVPFHPKGDGNGYILTLGGKRIYLAADTENIPEMKGLGHIDVAFLPMSPPYTMNTQEVADAARILKPEILYPYHTIDTDPSRLPPLLKGEEGIEIRIRRMK